MLGIDYSQLEDFDKEIIEIAKTKYPKEARNFMQRAGNAFRKDARSATQSLTQRKTGNLLKGLKRGRAYLYHGDEWQVRVKNSAPHAHLVEHGHELWFHHNSFATAKDSGKRVAGKHPVGSVVTSFGGKFTRLTEDFVNDFLEKGFS